MGWWVVSVWLIGFGAAHGEPYSKEQFDECFAGGGNIWLVHISCQLGDTATLLWFSELGDLGKPQIASTNIRSYNGSSEVAT